MIRWNKLHSLRRAAAILALVTGLASLGAGAGKTPGLLSVHAEETEASVEDMPADQDALLAAETTAGETTQETSETASETESAEQPADSETGSTETDPSAESTGEPTLPAETSGEETGTLSPDTPGETTSLDDAGTPAETSSADLSETPGETSGTDSSETPSETLTPDDAGTPAETPSVSDSETPAETTGENIGETPAETTPAETSAAETTAEETTAEETTAEAMVFAMPMMRLALKAAAPVPVQTEAEFEASLAAFPESYHAGLRAIHASYPNWRFHADLLDTDWEDAVRAETVLGISCIYTGEISSLKSTQAGAYNWDTGKWVGMDGDYWVTASEGAVRHYLDPRIYLDSRRLFAFLDYTFDPDTQNVEGVERMVEGTYLAGTYTEDGKTYRYVDTIMKAAEDSGMNPYLIAETIIVENGRQGQGRCISGTVAGYEGYYNFFNIGAYAANGMGPIERGLWYASRNSTYGRPWNTRQKAITGGCLFYMSNYVNGGQNTLYKKKFFIENGSADHQYMTNVQGTITEGITLGSAYTEEMKELALSFSIPVYKNMPSSIYPLPTGDGSPDNRLSSLKVDGCTLSPAFSTDTLSYTLTAKPGVNSLKITANPKASSAKVSGAGTVAVQTGSNTLNVVVTAENGQTRTYVLKVEVKSSETRIGSVTVNSPYLFENGRCSGLNIGMTASEFLSSMKLSGGTAQITKADGSSPDRAGTGNLLIVKDANGGEAGRYTLVLYGDATGDGRVTSADLLRIQRSILGMTQIDDSSRAAADANHDGRVTSSDLLRIQRSILGMDSIVQ